jgi:hypothetical protein
VKNQSPRFPVVYLTHGGGPWPFVEIRIGSQAERDEMAAYLRGLGTLLPSQPKAVLVISAHWEAARPTVMTHPSPPLLFDYYGFPDAAYELTWPAPGAPDLARRVRDLLSAAGIDSGEDDARGFDHGTFVPLKLTYPRRRRRCSSRSDLDPKDLAIGRCHCATKGLHGGGMTATTCGWVPLAAPLQAFTWLTLLRPGPVTASPTGALGPSHTTRGAPSAIDGDCGAAEDVGKHTLPAASPARCSGYCWRTSECLAARAVAIFYGVRRSAS